MSEKLHVFVYGTLKKNEPNYHWLTNEENGRASFISIGKTKELYPLVIASQYNIPFLLDKAGTGNHVQGEIYEIDEKMLANLDILEEYPHLYTRRVEDIIVPEEVSAPGLVKAWAYFLPSFQPDMLDKPYLASYSSKGPHNLPYLERYLRDQAVDHRKEVKVMS